MDKIDLNSIKHVLLLGATGGIGQAIMNHLLDQNSSLVIHALTRSPVEHPRVHNAVADVINESGLTEFMSSFPSVKFEMIINTVGYLENELGGPEKSLRDISEEKLIEYFRANAVLTPVLAKVVRNHLSDDGFVFVALSAMVGSIGENELGGWYGYRASKAALNAFIKNIAIEWRRSHKKSLVLAIHPGTTHTSLSEKFSTNVTHKIHSPSESAANICNVIFGATFAQSGSFLNWDGRVIQW